MFRYLMSRYLIVSIALLLSACTTSQISHTVYLEPQAKVALLPIVNHSQTPLAGASAANILTSLWYQKHLPQLVVYPYQTQSDLSFATGGQDTDKAEQWLSQQTVDYVLRGDITEWHYKSDLGGEPVASVTLSLYKTGVATPIWTGSVAKTGWGRDNLAGTAQKVLDDLLDNIEAKE